ncbi:MAG: hypothetical protein EOP36_15340 [Rubrivivax sp.]|nr:MAG: hypothetical protein EOP36_15340 [Rubrivivax sp.]
MNEWKTFTGRLLWAMSRAGKTNQSELARAVGVKPQSIQYLCHPESHAQGSTHTAALARELRVSADWLATGHGQAAALEQSLVRLDEPVATSYARAPAVQAPVFGAYRFNQAGEVEKLDTSSPGDGHVLTPIVAANVRAARVKGNALSPYAKDGQYLLLQAATEPLSGEDVLIITLTDGRTLIRELMHQRDGSLVVLPIQGGQPEAIEASHIVDIDAVVCVVPRRWWQSGTA